jgi:ASC-1-like (ASCH) protein
VPGSERQAQVVSQVAHLGAERPPPPDDLAKDAGRIALLGEPLRASAAQVLEHRDRLRVLAQRHMGCGHVEYLKLITDGAKMVEVRVGYPRMRTNYPGQDLTFVSGDQRVPSRVKRITECRSFEDMLSHEDIRAIGGELGESREELLATIRSIYPPEKERLGVLAIEIELT